ncbi:MAG TPA: thiamine-phosphate kinase [Thermoguttaceae bacterium]|nr:thiamine-phosphate kinase [Thermoguttaceae bacterium]
MESELIAHLRRRLPSHPLLRLGIGDDAAVLRLAEVDDCVLTVDLLTDHVDFELARVDPRRVGRKALAVNLSDLAAMAAEPLAGVVALVLPREGGMELAVALYEGLLPLAEQYGVAIAGGDTNSWDGPLALSVTLLGKVTPVGPLERSGAMPGDRIVVTGAFGGSILGHHLDFEPRVAEALRLAEAYELHAGIDVSDGLSIDLAHLARESGCGATVEIEAVPVAEDACRLVDRLADGSTPLEHALSDGEDFELILAVPPGEADRMLAEQPLDVRLTSIGRFVREPGLWQQDAQGKRVPLVPRGYQHEFD